MIIVRETGMLHPANNITDENNIPANLVLCRVQLLEVRTTTSVIAPSLWRQ